MSRDAGVSRVIDEAAPDLFEATDAPMPLSLPARGQSGPKGGRPKGAVNRRTADMVRYILSQHRSPLVVMAQTYTRSPRELAIELEMFARNDDGSVKRGADGEPLLAPGALVKAFELQQQSARDLAPYLHSKMPQAVELTSDRPATLVVIGDLSVGGGDAGLALPLPIDEENQQDTLELAAKSDDDKSDGAPK